MITTILTQAPGWYGNETEVFGAARSGTKAADKLVAEAEDSRSMAAYETSGEYRTGEKLFQDALNNPYLFTRIA